MGSIMQSALDLVLPYTHTRKQFNTPIAHNQLVQGKLADMYVRLQTSRAFTHMTASTIDHGGKQKPSSTHSKHRVIEFHVT